MKPFRCYVPFALLALAPAPSAQEQGAALANESFVETCEPPVQRRLDAGLAALRDGDAKAALPQLLPALRADLLSPHLRWSPRETRRFHDVLESMLRSVSAEQCLEFTGGFERGANTALAQAALDPEQLRQVLLQFPGTDASYLARLRLCDRGLERGDVVAAAFWLRGLAAAESTPRRALLAQLLHRANGDHPRPYGLGRIDGSASSHDCTPAREAPETLQRGPQRWLVPGRTGALVGRNHQGDEFAILQTPIDAVRIDPATRGVQPLGLTELSGVPSGFAARPTPSLSGDTLYLVHGTSDPASLGVRGWSRPGAEQRGSALLAIALDPPSLRWKWSPSLPPPSAGEDPPELALHPHALAIGKRIYVLFSSLNDPLRRQVYAACLSENGDLLWQHFLAQGAPITRELVESRQETLGAGRHVPAAPIFADGLLVCATGLGVVCGLDPIRGEMQWSFRTARVSSLGAKESPWHEGRLAQANEELWFAPSDSSWFYRLRSRAGLADRLAAIPRGRESLTQFLSLSSEQDLAVFLRQGLVETAPAQLRLAPPRLRGQREDAPPLQPGEHFVSAASTSQRLWLASNRAVYELDLGRELFYSRLLELPRARIEGVYAMVPLRSGLVLATPSGVFLWR